MTSVQSLSMLSFSSTTGARPSFFVVGLGATGGDAVVDDDTADAVVVDDTAEEEEVLVDVVLGKTKTLTGLDTNDPTRG